MEIDEYYCLNLVEARERHRHCVHEFERIGLSDKIKFWYTTRRPIMAQIGKKLTGLHTPAYLDCLKTNPYALGAVFSCVFEHYSIIKQAYERQLQNICVFEDDIHFIADQKQFEYVIDNIPNDYHLCKLHYSGEKMTNTPEIGKPVFKVCQYQIWSTLAYVMSRQGMEEYIYQFENGQIRPSDLLFEKLTNKYINDCKICRPFGFRSVINNSL